MNKEKLIAHTIRGLKVLVFFSFIYVFIVMVKLRNISTAIDVIFTVSLFLIFNKIDSMDKKINLLEKLNGGDKKCQ